MSKDIIVLTPNGRRLTVHCTPDTSILQVLEDVCAKQGFQANEYGLKHHNHHVDLTTTIRFSNLPNRACLEMVEAEQRREESNVTVALVLEDGERKTGEFPPSTNLFDLVSSLAENILSTLQNPAVQYMRQEVVGTDAMKVKTLRQLGLIHGRAIIRLMNKAEEQTQANVSAIYNVRPKEAESKDQTVNHHNQQHVAFDPVNKLKQSKVGTSGQDKTEPSCSEVKEARQPQPEVDKTSGQDTTISAMDVDPTSESSQSSETHKPIVQSVDLERRLKIEDEVTFLGSQKAVAFTTPDNCPVELEDLTDEFYELSVEELRRLQRQLQEDAARLQAAPLMPLAARQHLLQQASQRQLNSYKNAVVRIQFPDHVVLQGIFEPSSTIQDVRNFTKEYLAEPEKPFILFTTPIQENQDPNVTLADARFVPCVHMHFKWQNGESNGPFLRDEIYCKQTPSDAANILASKYRAPTRRRPEEAGPSRPHQSATTAKIPKWFKK